MTIRRVHIRRWDILFYLSFGTEDKERILDALIWAQAPESVIQNVSENISAGNPNEGFCYSNPRQRKTVIGVSETTTGPEFLNSVVHEIAHVAMHIAEEDWIDPYSEELAYLMGDISRDISYVVCELSCPHCRKKVL